MRTRTGLTLLSLAAALLAGAGCASKPVQEPPSAAVVERDCEHSDNNPLHLTRHASSVTAVPKSEHDPAVDSILMQSTSDWRLAQINRQMYQSLRALDSELRGEERIATCRRSLFDDELQAQVNKQQSSQQANDSVMNGGGGAGGSAGPGALAVPVAAAPLPSDAALDAPSAVNNGVVASSAVSNGASAGATRTSALRKTSISSASGGGAGNGALGPKVAPGNDNDVVLRRLRKAAEQETNPSLRAKLWKEYTDYKQGAAAK